MVSRKRTWRYALIGLVAAAVLGAGVGIAQAKAVYAGYVHNGPFDLACLDAGQRGTGLIGQACNKGVYQRWYYHDNGHWETLSARGYCLNDSGLYPGRVNTTRCFSNARQTWYHTQVGRRILIRNAHSRDCLAFGDFGTPLLIKDCNRNDPTQLWLAPGYR